MKKGKHIKESNIEEQNKVLGEIMTELNTVKEHPRLLLLATHGVVELLVNTIVFYRLKRRKDVLADSRSFTHYVKLIILHEIGILDNRDFELYNWLRDIRNKAAHEWKFKIKDEDMIVLKLNAYADAKAFYSLCEYLIGHMWNKYVFEKTKSKEKDGLDKGTILIVAKAKDPETGNEIYVPI